jgi:predicted Zn-dependent protease with MMP-like domain
VGVSGAVNCDRTIGTCHQLRRDSQHLLRRSANILGGKVGHVADTKNPETFDQIVEWAYSTLPQEIRDLTDFPGIQVADEPPADVLADMSKRKKWPHGTELLGLFSGIHRTQRRHSLLHIAPDLIFVFRGPILRCSKGDLRAEVKEVVWHEVAHWLGHDEEEVKELGLTTLA